MLGGVRRPLHIIAAADDPFVPPFGFEGSDQVTMELSPTGGHVAFVEGPPWRPERYAEQTAVDALLKFLKLPLEPVISAKAS